MQAHGAGTSARSNNFDALRLLAALLVIWSHQFAVMGLPVPQLLHNEPGALGVVIFFAISGYLVTLSWLADPHLGRFAARRALRIWPGLIAAVLLCAFVLGPLVTTLPLKAYLAHPLTWDYLRNLWLDTQFALPGVFDGNVLASSVNGPLWTIPLEVGCYAFLAAAGALGVMRWPWVAPLAFLALLLGMQWHYSPAPGAAMPAWSFGLQYGMVFALGATLACWRHLWIERRPLAMTAMLLLLAVLYFKGPAIIAGQAPLLALAVFPWWQDRHPRPFSSMQGISAISLTACTFTLFPCSSWWSGISRTGSAMAQLWPAPWPARACWPCCPGICWKSRH